MFVFIFHLSLTQMLMFHIQAIFISKQHHGYSRKTSVRRPRPACTLVKQSEMKEMKVYKIEKSFQVDDRKRERQKKPQRALKSCWDKHLFFEFLIKMKTEHRLSLHCEPSRSTKHPSCLSGREDGTVRISGNSIRVINTSANEEPSCLKHWRCEKAHSHLNTPSLTDWRRDVIDWLISL